MYSLFTKYAGETCDEIPDTLATWVDNHCTELKVLTQSSFVNHKPDFNWWKLAIINRKRPGNQLSLYCLCKIYHRHAIIYNETDYWTTIADMQNSTEEEIVNKCDIVLVYLGDNKFCEVLQCAKGTTKQTKKRVTKSIREICNQTKKLNLNKHNHDTRDSVQKRLNKKPNQLHSQTRVQKQKINPHTRNGAPY